jgi:uncharacterized protein YndB with AHSA1/START domain
VIDAVTRKLSHREHGGSIAHVIAATRTFAIARKDLWNALTDPQRITRWFLPISGDLRWRHLRLQGNAGVGTDPAEAHAAAARATAFYTGE